MTFTVATTEQEQLLLRADATATQGIDAGFGGPFGAILRVYYPGQEQMLAYDFADTHNRVRSTGFAGAHAEHNAMELAIKNGLYDFLSTHPSSVVVLFSSGESCSNCRTKEEILARDLIVKGLIQPKQFIVYYGATFDDAKELAGFNDAPYLTDFQKPQSQRKIPVEYVPLSGSRYDPGAYAAVLNSRGRYLASINAHDTIPSVLHNAATMAIQMASAKRIGKTDKPWDLGGATLLLHGRHSEHAVIGPLTYATAQWANIGKIIVTFTDGKMAPRKSLQDSAHIGNTNLFKIAAGPYEESKAVVTIHTPIVRDKLQAQRHWGELLRTGQLPRTALYNGLQM